MNKNTMYYMVRLDRVAAWVLLASIFVFIISGYGMTKGVISGELAQNLHNHVIPYIFIVSFLFHTFFAIHLALKRWRLWRLGKPILIIVYILLALSFVYVDQFYKKQQSTESKSESESKADENSSSSGSGSKNTQVSKTFSTAELAKYNGQNGQPAYVAVDGVVYDLSSVFTNGSHFSHLAGQELTSAFYSEHSAREIQKYPIVGTYKK
jgi:predicted heme/steroid binding protein